jgi:DNA invertase Pin-like site-specific DNA recombinase
MPATPSRTRTVAYIRVSTDKQADHGVSIDAQRAKVDAYAALYDLDLVAVEVDAGVSAKTLTRPALARALSMLDTGEVDALLVVKLDRLTRSIRDLDTLISRYFDREGGPALMSVSEQIDTRSAAGRLVLNVLAAVSQWEREAIGERTRAALAHKRSQGELVGSVPLGCSLAEDGRTLTRDEAEAEAMALILDLRAGGMSLRRIAAELNQRGVPSRGKRWHATTVARVVKRGEL